jgi:hypothetical protein
MAREKPRGIKEQRALAILERRKKNDPSALEASSIAEKTNFVLNLIDSSAAGSEARAGAVFNLTSSRAAASEERSR